MGNTVTLLDHKQHFIKLAAALYDPQKHISFGGGPRKGGFGPAIARREYIYFNETGAPASFLFLIFGNGICSRRKFRVVS